MALSRRGFLYRAGPAALGAAVSMPAVQIDTCCPNFLIQEYNTTALHNEIFVKPLRFEKGFITPPTGPGLGVELDQKVLKRQPAS